MTYALIDGTMEGDQMGFLPLVSTMDPETPVEQYLAQSMEPKRIGGMIPSPRTAPALTVAPSTAAELVSGSVLEPVVDWWKKQYGYFVEPPKPTPLPAIAIAVAAAAWFLGRGRRR